MTVKDKDNAATVAVMFLYFLVALAYVALLFKLMSFSIYYYLTYAIFIFAFAVSFLLRRRFEWLKILRENPDVGKKISIVLAITSMSFLLSVFWYEHQRLDYALYYSVTSFFLVCVAPEIRSIVWNFEDN